MIEKKLRINWAKWRSKQRMERFRSLLCAFLIYKCEPCRQIEQRHAERCKR